MFHNTFLSYVKSSDEEKITLDIVRTLHHKLSEHFSIIHSSNETIEKLKKYVEKIIELKYELNTQILFDSILYAYEQRNKKYPSEFTMRIALEYFESNEKLGINKIIPTDNSSVKFLPNLDISKKVSEIQKHLERISLVKLQLTKNLKELESQGEGHLWIDQEFIEPALDTLKGSLTQIQDIENRMLVLKSTYQDYQG